MFEDSDKEYLKRILGRNEVVLFLGAGFSADATNLSGGSVPLGRAVAEKLWALLGYSDPYDGTPLPDMYEAVLQSGVPFDRVKSLLEGSFLTQNIPNYYNALTRVFWYRIYTTNIDDLVSSVYRRVGEPKLQVIAYPRDEPRERDQGLESIQIVYLHGRLPCRPDEVTFSVRQYARRANEVSPLYQHFVSDYAVHPTIFIGTELNEPLFWQHIEARERRLADLSEQRPKSFLISPKISPPKRAQLKAYNVVPVEGLAREFLEWLSLIAEDLPPREEVLQTTLPSVAALLRATDGRQTDRHALREFGKSFHLVPSSMTVRGDRSFYLLGATPRWEDIFRELDAPRAVTERLLTRVENYVTGADSARVLAILGSAGSGKSTILRRLGVRLAQAGRSVFLTNSEEIPKPEVVAEALDTLKGSAILLFDNAEIALGSLADIVEATSRLAAPPLLIVASRTNEFDRRSARLEKAAEIAEFEVPNLNRAEIRGIIQVLDDQGLLGELQGMSPIQRIEAFEERAGKQLLVAMREATKGKGFDDIIKDEFHGLASGEIKLLYLCVALATDAGYRVTTQQFVKCASVSPGEALHILHRNLRGVVIHTGPRKDLLLLRHRLIAEYMLNSAAPRAMVSDAYVRLLGGLGAEFLGAGPYSRTYGLYRELVNHKQIYDRFSAKIEDARAIYDSVSSIMSSDAHFWLQYGLLELEFGNLELAENYLRQAESLYPKSYLVQNSIGHLFLRKAVEAESISEAAQYRVEGSELLQHRMLTDDSPYPYHIYCSQRLIWARKWITERSAFLVELEHLRAILRDARRSYPRNRRLRGLQETVEHEYLTLATVR